MRILLAALLGSSGCLNASSLQVDGGGGGPADLGSRPPSDLNAPTDGGQMAAPDQGIIPSADLGWPIADAAAPFLDLGALGDLAQPIAFCDGTLVAGTCVVAFFLPVASCFAPAGDCTESKTATDGVTCWQNGARLTAVFDQTMPLTTGTWSGTSPNCMDGTVMLDPNGRSPVFTLHAGGATLVYNAGNGEVTCPDGSMVNIGPDEGRCAQLKSILDPSTANCATGTCPP